MPRLTGGELATSVRKRWPEVKVLVATGYAEMPDDYKGKFAQLFEPFSSDDLRAAIELATDTAPAVV